MAKNKQAISVDDAVYKLQLSLLDGIKTEDQLFAAGSLLSRSDYLDVVTERSIAAFCGYPLCPNSLPADRDRKSRRYRISLKEHKVYDLQEASMYCSSACVVSSKAFAGSLKEDRSVVVNAAKVEQVLRLFEGLSLGSEEESGGIGDLGFSDLKIEEKEGGKDGEVRLEDWIGPSNAIEGYVPQREKSNSVASSSRRQKEGECYVPVKWLAELKDAKPKSKQDAFFSEMDFMSTIITQDEYSISKTSSAGTSSAKDLPENNNTKRVKGKTSAGTKGDSSKKLRKVKSETSKTPRKNEPITQDKPVNSCQTSSNVNNAEAEEKPQAVKAPELSESMPKSKLKPSGSKKSGRSVTWADEKVDSTGCKNLCEFKEIESTEENRKTPHSVDPEGDFNMIFESAEACAAALSQAAEAVASGELDATDAISEAGVIILPQPLHSENGDPEEDGNVVEEENAPLKWPTKPGIPPSEHFDPEDSWYDSPPEGFSLTLSPFATMWMALFAWVTSSSLAYIYGRDESSHEDYLEVNGREYPQKIVLRDGRSNEIKQTVAICLSRAFPGLVADLRLGTPISMLERGAACLLDTMSFIDAVPAFRAKQWQVIALLFLEALSISRLPALLSYMANRQMVLRKVLDGAHITVEEYETMKDLLIPLGRAPEFSPQSGA
ncbi:hypothetical protein Tsubulata_034922 [Turnera subulata]|uniref:RNA polymerase II subunit B1 CTD phosphatase RPAP2 homolog n=1 Tax=Turnera subulata TaxID=218843 RepID=A0A9Q0G528_9ROSI|nr:hypothetical protein Tsubulata_034922 [Turnera subulata]